MYFNNTVIIQHKLPFCIVTVEFYFDQCGYSHGKHVPIINAVKTSQKSLVSSSSDTDVVTLENARSPRLSVVFE